MSRLVRPTDYRGFCDVLRAHGGVPVRLHGTSHQVWRLPSGQCFTLSVCNGTYDNRRRALNYWRDLKRVLVLKGESVG